MRHKKQLIFQENDLFYKDKSNAFEIAMISAVGDREQQQDAAGYAFENGGGIAVVCDGMGGCAGGEKASLAAVETVLKGLTEKKPGNGSFAFLIELAEEADKTISGFQNEDGTAMLAGSTIVCVYIQNNLLYWLSVGDSHIYINRGRELVQVTKDHTLKNLLDHELETGMISYEEYSAESRQGEGLVSYLGINGIPYIEANDRAFHLKCGDRILLASDGLYKTIEEQQIEKMLNDSDPVDEALYSLKTEYEKRRMERPRDNMTAVLIKIN